MDDGPSYLIASHSDTSGLHIHPPQSSNPTHTFAPTTLPLRNAITHYHFSPYLISISANPSGTSSTFLTYSIPSTPATTPRKPDTRCPPPPGGGLITAVSISPDDSFIIAGAKSGRMYCWGYDGVLFKEWDGHYGEVRCIEWGKDGEVVVSGGGDGGLLIWEVGKVVGFGETVQVWKSLMGHSLGVVAVSMGFGGVTARMVSVGGEGDARIWHVGSGQCLGVVVLGAVPRACIMTVDEDWAWVGLVSGELVGFEVGKVSRAAPMGREGCQVLRGGEWGSLDALVFSKDENEVIAGYEDGQVRTWEVQGGVVVFTYRKHSGSVRWLGLVEKKLIEQHSVKSKCKLVLERNVVTAEDYRPLIEKGSRDSSERNIQNIWEAIDEAVKQVDAERDAARMWKETQDVRCAGSETSEAGRLRAENQALRSSLQRLSNMVADNVLHGR
eukprot:Plantae.Rhodophyta-Hildenbrandia_rubra.ctg4020.p1 GENE.Plantae.Rhodophyta-Hildenbrandia_rubra.ctg4020~~Plantae.Rhodophyta-Hildenbrandia_rubra.ctg4020.p1  ORF type:complete len:441 (-),score=72.09 Plantae.Rhodophyta-Hildenbrandia_rubra.ctg4020:239-1561(-)